MLEVVAKAEVAALRTTAASVLANLAIDPRARARIIDAGGAATLGTMIDGAENDDEWEAAHSALESLGALWSL